MPHPEIPVQALPIQGERPGDIKFDNLIAAIGRKTDRVKAKLEDLSSKDDSFNVMEMLKMQMDMNNLMQLTDTTSNVQYAAHQANMSLARNVK